MYYDIRLENRALVSTSQNKPTTIFSKSDVRFALVMSVQEHRDYSKRKIDPAYQDDDILLVISFTNGESAAPIPVERYESRDNVESLIIQWLGNP